MLHQAVAPTRMLGVNHLDQTIYNLRPRRAGKRHLEGLEGGCRKRGNASNEKQREATISNDEQRAATISKDKQRQATIRNDERR